MRASAGGAARTRVATQGPSASSSSSIVRDSYPSPRMSARQSEPGGPSSPHGAMTSRSGIPSGDEAGVSTSDRSGRSLVSGISSSPGVGLLVTLMGSA